MKRIFYVVSLLSALLFAVNVSAQDIGAMEEDMKKNVAWLTAPERMGRGAGTGEEKEVAEYLYKQLQEAGVVMLSPIEGEDFFMAQGKDTLHSRNIIGMVEGYDPKLRDEYIVIGAHYDHLGKDSYTRNGEKMELVFPGADDNASGVATLVEVAKAVAQDNFLFRRSVIFALFGSNELGMAGSWYFLNRSFGQVDKIVAMINLDMVGRSSRENFLQIFVAGSNKVLVDVNNKLSGRALSIAPKVSSTDYFPSDHRNFHEMGIPSVLFTSGMHRDYHTVRDTPDKLDYTQMAYLAEYVYAMAQELADRDGRPSDNVVTAESGERDSKGDKDKVYAPASVDKMASFLHGGVEQFLKRWVYEYIKYPDSAVRNGIKGTVVAEFVLDEKGKVTNVQILKGLDDEIDAEVVKVISASPKWKPAILQGKPVSVRISVPVEFKLTKSGSFKIKK